MRARDQALIDSAKFEGKAACLETPAVVDPATLAKDYAKRTMAVWEEEDPLAHSEPPRGDFSSNQGPGALKQWMRDRDDGVAERHFRASDICQGMIESFLAGYQDWAVGPG